MTSRYDLTSSEIGRLRSLASGVVFFWLFTWFSGIFGMRYLLPEGVKQRVLEMDEGPFILVFIIGIVLWNIVLRLIVRTSCPKCKKNKLKLSFFFKSYDYKCLSCNFSVSHEELNNVGT